MQQIKISCVQLVCQSNETAKYVLGFIVYLLPDYIVSVVLMVMRLFFVYFPQCKWPSGPSAVDFK